MAEQEQRKGKYITTYTGRRFYPLDPRPEEMFLLDMAHSLSSSTRFTGHTRKMYFISDHCLRVAKWIQKNGGSYMDQLCGLMHDGDETWTPDMASPLKHEPEMAEFVKVGNAILERMAQRFGLPWPFSPIVKEADKAVLKLEIKYLLKDGSRSARDMQDDPWPEEFQAPLSHEIAKRLFMSKFFMLSQLAQTEIGSLLDLLFRATWIWINDQSVFDNNHFLSGIGYKIFYENMFALEKHGIELDTRDWTSLFKLVGRDFADAQVAERCIWQ